MTKSLDSNFGIVSYWPPQIEAEEEDKALSPVSLRMALRPYERLFGYQDGLVKDPAVVEAIVIDFESGEDYIGAAQAALELGNNILLNEEFNAQVENWAFHSGCTIKMKNFLDRYIPEHLDDFDSILKKASMRAVDYSQLLQLANSLVPEDAVHIKLQVMGELLDAGMTLLALRVSSLIGDPLYKELIKQKILNNE